MSHKQIFFNVPTIPVREVLKVFYLPRKRNFKYTDTRKVKLKTNVPLKKFLKIKNYKGNRRPWRTPVESTT